MLLPIYDRLEVISGHLIRLRALVRLHCDLGLPCLQYCQQSEIIEQTAWMGLLDLSTQHSCEDTVVSRVDTDGGFHTNVTGMQYTDYIYVLPFVEPVVMIMFARTPKAAVNPRLVRDF